MRSRRARSRRPSPVARRKKRAQEPTPSKKPENAESGFGSLRDQFAAMLGDAKPTGEPNRAAKRGRSKASENKAITARFVSKPAPPPAPAEPQARVISAEDLMAEAFAAAETSAATAKYEGQGYDPGDVVLKSELKRQAEPDPTVPDDDGVTSDDLLLAEMFGNVDPMSRRDKYADLHTHEWTGLRWHNEQQLSSMTAEELQEPEITAKQREVLKHARRAGTMAVLNVRHMRKAEALGELEAFVHGCLQRDERFARIVHGKGKQSTNGPVLKPAVIGWCRGLGEIQVRAWAPETDMSGQFGSIVIELRLSR